MREGDRPEQPPVLQWVRGKVVTPPPADAATGPGAAAGSGPLVTAASAIAAGLPYRGDLATDPPLRLLHLAAAASATGRLGLLTDGGRFSLTFRRGVLEAAASDVDADALGVFLVRRGVVRPEVLARAERERGRFAGDLVSALVSLDAFLPARDVGLLQEHAGALVTKAIACVRGTVEWTPGLAEVTGFPLAGRWALVCEGTRRLDPEVARALLGDGLTRVASRTRGRVDLTELKLTPQEARVAGLFDGRTTVAQLCAARPTEAATLVRVACLLAGTELLQFTTQVDAPSPPAPGADAAGPAARAKPPPVPAAKRPPAPAPGTPGASVAPTAAVVAAAPVSAPAAPAPGDERSTLEALHQKLQRADHFEVLGAARTATTAQLKASYFQLAKRFHPDAGSPEEPAEAKKLRADIFARIGEAWAVLGNDATRAEYLAQLGSSGPGEVDVSHIVRGEETFRKATVLVRARQYAQALTTLQQAIEQNPEEPEFAVWLAWTRFLLAPDRPAQRAASNAVIEAALDKAPRCAAGYLFLAQMARLTGDVAAAERHLRRGLAIAPQHDELTRELKFIEQKHPRK